MFRIQIAIFSIFSLITSSFAATSPIDTAKTKLTWNGTKVTGAHNGSIQAKGGNLEFDGEKLTGGRIVIDMKSLKVADMAESPEMQKKLAGHLMSADFFEADKFPEAVFVIKSVKPIEKATGKENFEITGDLTIKEKTHPATLRAHLMTHGPLFHGNGKLTVDRTLYDVRYGSGKFFKGLGDKLIHDTFDVGIDLYAKIPSDKKITKKSK